ncbi:oligosaccharide flippase family protein [archaeon]|nr:oligosaccharide flippase family protein [archaeon]
MARMLGPSDYGILAVLMSVVYIFSIPTEAIQNVITKYTAIFSSEKENGKIKLILARGLRGSVIAAIAAFLLFIPLSYLLSVYLKIDFLLFVITGALLFFVLASPVLRGALQGQKRFFSLGWNMVAEGFVKLLFAVFLVAIGWKVYGSIFAVVLGSLSAFVLAVISLTGILKEKGTKEDLSGIYSYSVPFFVVLVAIVLIYSLDIIFARAFFDAETAGKYAVASMLGKMIYFGTLGISKAMFPLASENHQIGKETYSILKKSLKMVGLAGGSALILFFLFPKLIINLLFGSQYTEVSGILFFVGLSFALISFTNVLLLYSLSVNKIKKAPFLLLIFVVLEISLFFIFHSTILEFSLAFLALSSAMFLYSIYLTRKT